MFDSRDAFTNEETAKIMQELYRFEEQAKHSSNCQNANICGIDLGVLGEDYTSSSFLSFGYKRNLAENELVYSDALEYVAQLAEENSEYQTYVFSILNENNLVFKYPSGIEFAEQCKKQDVIISDILPITMNNIGFLADLRDSTGGMHINDYNFAEIIFELIFDKEMGKLPAEPGKKFISSHNLEPIELNEIPDIDYYKAYLDVNENPDNKSKYSEFADTDNDGLYDFQEIDFSNYRFAAGDIVISDEKLWFSKVSDYLAHRGLSDTGLSGYEKEYPILPVTTRPNAEDTDGDGLLDGKAIKDSQNRVIAPPDNAPKIVAQPLGVWKSIISTYEFENVSTATTNSYYWENADLEDMMIKYFSELFGVDDETSAIISDGVDFLESTISYTSKLVKWGILFPGASFIRILDVRTAIVLGSLKEAADILVGVLVDAIFDLILDQNLYNESEDLIRNLYDKIGYGIKEKESLAYFKKIFSEMSEEDSKTLVKVMLACYNDTDKEDIPFYSIINFTVRFLCEYEGLKPQQGAFFLDMLPDKSLNIHAMTSAWQRKFGYNEFYDFIFELGTYMAPETFEFSAGNVDYILWMWRGDYLNLGSGTEIGLYQYDATYTGTEHYDVVDFELPMTLNLYRYNSAENSVGDKIFNWMPSTPQWWITGFNPNVKDVMPEEMVTVGSVDFSSKSELYKNFKSSMNDNKNKDKKNFLIFDDENKTVWVDWWTM
ncbi:MAG: DUF4474 domain-containing protein [Oscillospiraceae bacterium]|nr:DUF4474 domain-containing protein [Oscillospiraceae bacterium]